MLLETERLLLRIPRPEDSEPLRHIQGSDYVLEFNPMQPLTPEGANNQVLRDAEENRAFYIEEKFTGRLAGGIWLGEDDLRYRANSLTLSYYLGEEFAGRGYMTEALRAAIPYAFTTFGLELVAARVFSGNRRSLRLLEKLGFVKEGTLRRAVRDPRGMVHDDALFSLLREEWEAQEAREGRSG